MEEERADSDPFQMSKDDMEEVVYAEMERAFPDHSFDNIFGVERCSDMLIENIVQPFRFPHLYTKPARAFTLFGVPGSGKSHLLSAAGKASGAKLFIFNIWFLRSRRVGATSIGDFLKTAFKIAHDNSPSILCFEDLEVICRDDMCEAKTSFVNEMQNFLAQNIWDLIVVIGVTQKPWEVDSSVREIFAWSPASHVTLPDADARVKILEYLFKDTPHSLQQEQFVVLSSRTAGFTGSDLVGLARDVAFRPLRSLAAATHFKKVLVKKESDAKTQPGTRKAEARPSSQDEVSDSVPSQTTCPNQETEEAAAEGLKGGGGETPDSLKDLGGEDDSFDVTYHPCVPDDDGAIPVSVIDLPEDKVHIRKVSMEDVEEALEKMKPCVHGQELERMASFELEYCVG